MQMTWHNVVFDEEMQIGAGEYTFEGRTAVTVPSLAWDEFVGVNRF